MQRSQRFKKGLWVAGGTLGAMLSMVPMLRAEIAATHVYHNHMPNFWAYFDPSTYNSIPVGQPIRYTYDGYVIELKESPPANYTYYLPDGQPMPHDDLVSYYSHHAKQGAYMYWPWDTATKNNYDHPLSQTQVTMSGSVVNNVQSLNELQNVSGYNNPYWGDPWRNTFDTVYTTNGYRALDLVHFSGHHALGPLVGREFLLKDMIFHNATLAQSYFLGDSFRSSKGFFPTELGFSERIIPTLKKLGVEWSVLGNVHFSRTLTDYPLLNDPGKDCMISPPNRSDLQNTSSTGEWVSKQMFNEAQVTYNKFPFASIPHWVRYVDPTTGEEQKVVGIPVEQASSWEEGYQGSITADLIKPFEDEAAALGRTQYFVIAHDGDNSSGRAGDGGTWLNSGQVTYADAGVTGYGVQEYLRSFPIPTNDIVHVQDGSWIDTRDSSSDPTWYHWHLPMCIWSGQFSAFNTAMGTDYAPKKNIYGQAEGNTVSLEYGYHYLERNYALLQAATNYARTAEQIWLETHPNHWKPTSTMDGQVTYTGNQLNPWMFSYPKKGDAAKDYTGGANPAELAWYFLLPAMDSGFGYYDENVDDNVKPTLAMNESLYFSKPYVTANLTKDKTGPDVWWPQRYPYNPGSANKSKAEGWTLHYFDNTFAIYTYAYDVSGMADIQVKIRTHTNKTISPLDKTCRVYNPKAFTNDPQIDPTKVSDWTSYSMRHRDLEPEMNGVDWQPSGQETMAILPAQEIGDLYYQYFTQYRDQLIDFYIEATDAKGNITRSDIQQVYIGAGKFKTDASGKVVEDVNGNIVGTYPFITDKAPTKPVTLYVEGSQSGLASITLQSKLAGTTAWDAGQQIFPLEGADTWFKTSLSYSTDYAGIDVRYTENGTTWKPSSSGTRLTTGTWTIYKDGTVSQGLPTGLELTARVYYASSYGDPTYMHWQPVGGSWTVTPGELMARSEYAGYWVLEVDLGAADGLNAAFNNGKGTWDSNGGKNYFVEAGISYIEGGKVHPGTPPGTPGNVPPIADAGDDLTVMVGDTVQLDGSGSTDPDGNIVSYSWSNGLTGVSPTKVYTVSGIYTVTLTVTDEDGASDTDTVTINVRSGSDNLVTVYYKRGYATPYIHYKQANGVWTTAPGMAMPNSDVAGYSIAQDLNIGSQSALECVFTDGKGSWDNNGGKNYLFQPGVWTYSAGTITAGAPETEPQTGNLVTVYYKQGYTTPYIHYKQASGVWTTAPGMAMPASEFAGYNIAKEINVGALTTLECVFTDGKGSWDNNGGKNYLFQIGTWTFAAGTITAGAPGPVNKPPVAMVSPSASVVREGTAILFSAADSYDSDGTLVKYTWSNGATGLETEVNYPDPGTFTLSLTVTDDDGAQASATATITVESNGAPTAVITWNEVPVVYTGDLLTFSAATSSDPEGDTLTYLWEDNDTAVEVDRVWNEPGTYTVKVVVTDTYGAWGMDEVTIVVEEDPSTGCNRDGGTQGSRLGLGLATLLPALLLAFRRRRTLH